MVKRKSIATKATRNAKRRRTASNSGGVVPPEEMKMKGRSKPKVDRKVTSSVSKSIKAQETDPTGSSEGEGVHPLLIDHILDKVFQYVIWPNSSGTNVDGGATRDSIKDLGNIRLVNKQWNENATKLFRRKRSMLVFGEPPTYERPNSYDLKMEGFLNAMKNSKLMPVNRYCLGTQFFNKQNQRLMKDFMRICGPTATELQLYFDNVSTMNFNRRSFPDLDLAKLKTLVLNCESCRGRNCSNQTHEIPYLIEVLLTAAESLQEFRIEIPNPIREVKWQSKIVKRFGESICRKLPATIRKLRLDIPVHDVHLRILSESELKLEEFQFDCIHVAGTGAGQAFLEEQAPYLKKLKILDSDPNGSTALNFPRFDRLLHMDLQGAHIKPFSYPETFPKLETLNLAEWKTETTMMELLPLGKKANSIKEIYLPFRFPQAPLVKKASQCFPNLKTVHISPSADIVEALQEAFIFFPEIEELHITFPFLLDNELNADSLFSGVSELDCRRILRHRNFETINIKDVQKKPSINNLTRLKKLVLEDSAGDLLLTDFAAHFIFMKMESLKELHTNKFRMSSKYVEMLRNKFTLKLADDDGSEFSDDSDGWNSDSSAENDELQIIPFLGLGFNIFFVR